jgi:uncharacterized membrane protein YbhN (UPF0104 family)/membrane-associated phospholipid phosphatase/tRNA A-37 threonylcarbamoyl transferase component Bud32
VPDLDRSVDHRLGSVGSVELSSPAWASAGTVPVAPADAPRSVPLPERRVAGPIGRHPGDVLRVAVGGAAVALLGAVARLRRVPRWEVDVFRLFNHLPTWLEAPVWVVMQCGSLVAVPVAGGVAVALRRPRLARDLVTSGSAAWLAAKVVKAVVERGRPGALLTGVILRGGAESGLGYPSGHAAVAAALATALGPHVSRPVRRTAWGLALAVALARVYTGQHLPVDVVGGLALGWAVGALLHLVWGTPLGTIRPEAVATGLRNALGRPFSVATLRVDARGSVPFLASGKGRLLVVKALGRRHRDADLLFKLWRWLVYRQVEDEAPFATPKQQAEHEAYLSLLAAKAGVSVPRVVTTIVLADGTALLVEEHVTGRPLDEIDPREVSATLLGSLWQEVARLRAAGIAHRDLRLGNVIVDAELRPHLIDFGFAEASASPSRLAQDVAELLASASVVAPPDQVVDAAVSVLGATAVAEAVPLLQPMALSAATRSAYRRRDLAALRELVAQQTGVDTPPAAPMTRIRPRTLLMLIGGGFAIHLLLPQVGELGQTLGAIEQARPGWLMIAAAVSVTTYPAAGLALVGASPVALPYWRTVAVQVATTFTNRLTPAGLGGIGLNVRYLGRSGLDRATAVGAVALSTAAGVATHALLLAGAAVFLGTHLVGPVHLPHGWASLVAVVSVLVALGLVLSAALGPRRFAVPLRRAARDLLAVLRRPRQALRLFGGSALVTLGYAASLGASLAAFGAGLSPGKVLLVYLGGTAIAAASPTPGGLGAVEAALVAGLTAAGARAGPAVAGVLTFRLFTFWLPILPGWLAFRMLEQRPAPERTSSP